MPLLLGWPACLNNVIGILLLLLGLTFGSFISALTYRYPRKISNIKGRSFCDNCHSPLFWYDNIPLISYILLRGRCRKCKKPISWRYPAIETVTAVGFLLIGVNIIYLILFCILECIFIIDFEHQIIPDKFIFWGIFFSLFTITISPFPHLFAGFLSSLLLLLIYLATGGRGMGLGDVKFAVFGGILVGLNLSLIWLFLAFLTGATAAIILIFIGKAKFKSKIAFGPFLVISVPLTLLWGEKLIQLLHL